MKKILLVVGVLALLLIGGCSALVLGVAIGTAGNEPQQKEKTLTDKQVDKKMDKAVEAEKKAAPPKEEKKVASHDGGLSSSASASTSASASGAASASATSQQPTSGEVAVKVQISANKPVDVSILSAEDMGVPMISEQTQDETYTFEKKADADLSVDASDPNMDLTGDADIHIEVYENDELVAEDSDSVMALVQY